MNTGSHNLDPDERRLIAGLRQALNITYTRVLDSVRREWEHSFAGKDPSDACVSVRVTSGDSPRPSLPCAGILRERRRSLVNGNRHGLLA